MRQRIISLVSVLSFVFIFAGYAEAIWLVDFVSKECWVETIEYQPKTEEGFDGIAYHTYADRKLQMVEFEDRNGNNKKIETYHYDDNGKLERIEFHKEDIGNITRVRYLLYNTSEDLTRAEHWDNRKESGGERIQIEELFYDGKGFLEYKEFYDVENDGEPNAIYSYYYDDEGKLIRIEKPDDDFEVFHYNLDGTIDRVESPTSTAEVIWECIPIDNDSGTGGGSGGSSTSGCFIGTFF